MTSKLILFISWLVALSVSASGQTKIPPSVTRAIVGQMIVNGDIQSSCSVDIYPEYLNGDRQPEYVVSGKGSCCGGARRCNLWIYQKTVAGYRKIYGDKDGLQGDIEILKTRTNGYLNIRSSMYSGEMTYQATSKFDGRAYQVDKKSLKSIRTGF